MAKQIKVFYIPQREWLEVRVDNSLGYILKQIGEVYKKLAEALNESGF